MKKIAITLVVVMILSLATILMASAAPARGYGHERWHGNAAAHCYGLLWDDNGNLISREAYEERLDNAIEDGILRDGDKAVYLERYDYCAANGGVCPRVSGRGRGGCGRGAMRAW